MQKNKIQVSQEYALGDGKRYDNSRAVRVRILDLDAEIQNGDGYPHYGRGTHQGITAQVIAKGDAYRYGVEDGMTIEVKPREIWETWEDWTAMQARLDAERARMEQQQNERTTIQQAAIDHMVSLVPAEVWAATSDGLGRPLKFEPGQTPRISIADLTRLLKGARTAALNEAFGDE